jgi:hypothetical protein
MMAKGLCGSILLVAGLLAGGAAHAQSQPGGGGTVPGHAQPVIGTENNDSTRMTGDDREARVAADRAVRETRERSEGSSSRRSRAVPATAADLVVGSEVRDSAGVPIGTIELVDAGGVQILSDGRRAKIPADAFGKNKAGLLIGMTKADFDKAVAASLGGS